MRLCLPCLVSALFLCPVLSAGEPLDYGDHSSATLTAKAWDALGQGELDAALAYTQKCLDLYQQQAREMQAGLKDFAPTQPPETASKLWALNDVGTCLFIRGEALLKKGDRKGASAAYRLLVEEFGFAQCWDTKGWFWKPAQAAKQKLVELEFDGE